MARVDIFSKKYYTDYHDVDEELRTIIPQGGSWWENDGVGVAFRRMIDPPTITHDDVASVQKINRTYSPFGDACSIVERQIDLYYLFNDDTSIDISIVMKYPSAWQTDITLSITRLC